MDTHFKVGKPSQNDIVSLAGKVMPVWKRLGRALGMSNETLYEIEVDFAGVYEQSYQMFRKWLEMKGSEATYATLAEALQHETVQRHSLISQYCCNVSEECAKEMCERLKDRLVLFENPVIFRNIKILLPEPFYGALTREKELNQIAELYNKSSCRFNALADDECIVSAVYLTGPPGSGKSQLARQFGEKYFNEKVVIQESQCTKTSLGNRCPPKGIVVATLRAETPTAFLDSLQNLCSNLSVDIEQEALMNLPIDCAIKHHVVELQKMFRTNAFDWLLIVDNLTIDKPFSEFLPRPGKEQRDWGSGKVLVTTQDDLTPVSAHAYSKTLSLASGMEKHDALKLLHMVSKLESDVDAECVASKLNYYPLSLACAAVYVCEMNDVRTAANFTWKKYLKSLEQYFEHIDYSAFAENNPCYPQSMLPAAVLSARRMAQNSDVIRASFEFLSECALAPVPLETVAEYAKKAGSNIIDPERLKVKIARCSLLAYPERGERGVEVVTIHQVIKLAFKQLRCEETIEPERATYERIVTVMNTSYQALLKSGDTQNIVTRSLLSPHLQECVTTGNQKEWTMSGNFMNCLVNLADALLHVSGSTDSHRTALLEQAYSIYKNLGLTDLHSCRMLRGLGYTYRESGNLAKVIPILDEANHIAENRTEQNWTRERSHILNTLAWTFREMFRLDMAKEYMKMCVTVTTEAFGSQHKEVIERLCNYGIILHDRWENEEAIKVLQEALYLVNEYHRDEQFIRAQVINYTAKIHLRWFLGLIYSEGKTEKVNDHLHCSKLLHEQALAIYSQLYGQNKGRFNAGTMMTYAVVLRYYGRLDDALKLCQKAVDIYRAAGHIAWPRAATWLADIHLAREEPTTAILILEDVLSEHERRALNISPGAYHPKALLGEARVLVGEVVTGKTLLEECLAEWKVINLHEKHYWFARTRSFLKSL